MKKNIGRLVVNAHNNKKAIARVLEKASRFGVVVEKLV